MAAKGGIVACALALCATQSAACGGPDAPCEVTEGTYHIVLPQGEAPPPVVIWLHGFGRSGEGMIKRASSVVPFTERGYAVIMPDGQPYPGSDNLDWNVEDGLEYPRDDVAFLRQVFDDAVGRHDLDPDKVLVAGFSRGGSMVWGLACQAPDTAMAYGAVAGAFWEPMATTCNKPVHLFHTHGLSDRLVPFEGRRVNFDGLDFEQGSVMKAFDVLRSQNGCLGAASNRVDESVFRKSWTDCKAGSLTLTLTQGGHGIPNNWRNELLDWFEELGGKP